jgi:hypothetical protein
MKSLAPNNHVTKQSSRKLGGFSPQRKKPKVHHREMQEVLRSFRTETLERRKEIAALSVRQTMD